MHIELQDGVLRARTGTVDALKHLHTIRGLPYRRFVPAENAWHIDHVRENWDALVEAGVDLSGIEPPTIEGARVDATKSGKTLLVTVAAGKRNDSLMVGLPDTHSLRENGWHVRPSRANVAYIKKHWPDVEWTDWAAKVVAQTEAPHVESKSDMDRLVGAAVRDFKFGTQPYEHQLKAFALSRDAKAFALLMEQGTGKTKVTIDKAGYLFVNGEITAMLVLCPKSIKFVWENEVETHLPGYIKRRILLWDHKVRDEHVTDLCYAGDDVLKVFVMNIDAINTERGWECAKRFLAVETALMVVDESSRIKQPAAKRTGRCITLGESAAYRQILTGTPVTQGPLDVFSQFEFLDPNIIGFNSFSRFRQHFAIMGGYNDHQVLRYVNMDELQSMVQPYSYRVTKEECLDLPAKIYRKVDVELTKEQRALYDDMWNTMVYTVEGNEVRATIDLTKWLRLHQVVGGFYPSSFGDPRFEIGEQKYGVIPGGNPKLDVLLDVVEDFSSKAIIWCHFVPEIFLIQEALSAKYGPQSCVKFFGQSNDVERRDAISRYEGSIERPHDPECRFFIAQSDTGSVGLTLVRTEDVVYYSNSFSLESRLQSEDRAHRIGQTKHVTYTDIMAKNTIDQRLVKVLRKKLDFANIITGDNAKDWL